MIGNVIQAKSGHVLIRIREDSEVNIGDIFKINENVTYFIKVIDLFLQSTIPSQFIEDIAGHKIDGEELRMFDSAERFYRIARAKILRVKSGENYFSARTIPNFFSEVQEICGQDLGFLKSDGIPIGDLRIGKRAVSLEVSVPAKKLISHHILIVAATGKGKSNFAKVFLKGLSDKDGFSAVVFDPHSEYYGSKGVRGLSELKKTLYITPQWHNFPGSEPLRIHSSELLPSDFSGISDLSSAQQEAISLFFKEFGREWAKALLTEDIDGLYKRFGEKVQKMTLTALRRKINFLMELDGNEGIVFSLKDKEGVSIFDKIRAAVNDERIVIIDTSLVGGASERLIASAITNREFHRYRKTKQKSPENFRKLPELLVVFEEAPRFFGRDTSTNVFERISREGRKFKVGVCAITQIPSLIPREILSQMNTKVILGLPSPSDREAVINSSSQDISDESLEIQILDRGEAIITSPFLEFPLPAKIHLFDNVLPEKKTMSGFQ